MRSFKRVWKKKPEERYEIADILGHEFIRGINYLEIEKGTYRPGVKPTDCTNRKAFMKNFCDDFTGLSKNIDEGEYDIRAMEENEDKVFSDFSWQNHQKVRHYQQ